MHQGRYCAFSVAVPSSMYPGMCAVRFATGSIPTSGTATSVFVLWSPRCFSHKLWSLVALNSGALNLWYSGYCKS